MRWAHWTGLYDEINVPLYYTLHKLKTQIKQKRQRKI